MTSNEFIQSRFPNLISEGRKYGLNSEQIHQLSRYLDDKRLLRMISLAKFNHDAKAWLSALTGIVANILAADAHINIWLNKKLEKPRNWILTKLAEVIPTKFDDIAVKAVQTAEEIYENKILPFKEQKLLNVNNKMHEHYQRHANATYLGNSMSDLKDIAKSNLKNSRDIAKGDALKTLKQRKFESHILKGYYDDSGNFVKTSKYSGKNVGHNALFKQNTILRKENTYAKEQKTQNISEGKSETTRQGDYP